MAKRVLEFEDYSNMNDEVACADVHGVVTHLSPVKKSKKGNNYFYGQCVMARITSGL